MQEINLRIHHELITLNNERLFLIYINNVYWNDIDILEETYNFIANIDAIIPNIYCKMIICLDAEKEPIEFSGITVKLILFSRIQELKNTASETLI